MMLQKPVILVLWVPVWVLIAGCGGGVVVPVLK